MPRAATLWAWARGRNEGAQPIPMANLAAGDAHERPQRHDPPRLGPAPGDALDGDDGVGPDGDRSPAAQIDHHRHRRRRRRDPEMQARHDAIAAYHRLAMMLHNIGHNKDHDVDPDRLPGHDVPVSEGEKDDQGHRGHGIGQKGGAEALVSLGCDRRQCVDLRRRIGRSVTGWRWQCRRLHCWHCPPLAISLSIDTRRGRLNSRAQILGSGVVLGPRIDARGRNQAQVRGGADRLGSGAWIRAAARPIRVMNCTSRSRAASAEGGQPLSVGHVPVAQDDRLQDRVVVQGQVVDPGPGDGLGVLRRSPRIPAPGISNFRVWRLMASIMPDGSTSRAAETRSR